MPYLNLDDNFADHPKVDALSDGAFRLHVAGLCYAAKHLTDGYVPAHRVPRLTRTYKPAYLAELLAAGMWLPSKGDGHSIHDYLQWNKPAEWWRAHREAGRKRVAKWRERNAEQDGDGAE